MSIIDECTEIKSKINKLYAYAEAFSLTGNHDMAAKLYALGGDLNDAVSEIEDQCHKEAAQKFEQAEQASNNVLLATVTGMRIGKEEKNQ